MTVTFLLFNSCLTVPSSKIEPVFVTNTSAIRILTPENISTDIDQMMLLSVEAGDSSFSTPVYVFADTTGIYITILNSFGIDMGTLDYNGESVDLECSLFPSNLKPVYLINEFQNAYYESSSIQRNLKKAHLVLEVSGDNQNSTRLIKSGKRVIEEIKLENGNSQITNYLRGYKITLLASE